MYTVSVCSIKQLPLKCDEKEMSNSAAIAISSYDININNIADFKSHLCLNFEDIDDAKNGQAFNSAYAKQIVDFVKNLSDDLKVLYVCCDSGESRSSAIAASIYRYLRKNDMVIWENPHFYPNPLVYKVLCKEFSIKITNLELKYKLWKNQKALSGAINKARKH